MMTPLRLAQLDFFGRGFRGLLAFRTRCAAGSIRENVPPQRVVLSLAKPKPAPSACCLAPVPEEPQASYSKHCRGWCFARIAFAPGRFVAAAGHPHSAGPGRCCAFLSTTKNRPDDPSDNN